ncbi:uncharacterized protein CLUP02_05620 [Colletotrichum lupini]|uniref:Uncharacterized protein n=1 Tax=Colletotrichum lupini TaxID=145971 RepID=A0A9Q8WDW2_9PEZI|nr:uncharacterized protein CLUP02_05620 [Colletotrichum lupini]UQC80138.1 hypothetical protein CLUP02_05620 [Colletotrichum lupini]
MRAIPYSCHMPIYLYLLRNLLADFEPWWHLLKHLCRDLFPPLQTNYDQEQASFIMFLEPNSRMFHFHCSLATRHFFLVSGDNTIRGELDRPEQSRSASFHERFYRDIPLEVINASTCYSFSMRNKSIARRDMLRKGEGTKNHGNILVFFQSSVMVVVDYDVVWPFVHLCNQSPPIRPPFTHPHKPFHPNSSPKVTSRTSDPSHRPPDTLNHSQFSVCLSNPKGRPGPLYSSG